MSLTFGSVCSGVEAASLAWEPLGMQPLWFAENEAFPSAVLAHRWPNVPNLGDMTRLAGLIRMGVMPAPAVLVGGTPCQAFSVAGARRGLEDERGQLTIEYVRIADAIDEQRPGDECVTVWENVPGVLSDKNNAFGCFLGALCGEDEPIVPAGKKWTNAGYVFGPQRAVAWRVIDAQYFGVAQRRRRVFVVASARDGFDPRAVLFESEGVRRDTAPSREAGPEAAPCPTLRAGGNSTGGDRPPGTDVDTCESLVPCFWDGGQTSQTLDAVLHKGQTMPEKQRFPAVLERAGSRLAVRRLTPRECERLQGEPDDHTRIPARWYAERKITRLRPVDLWERAEGGGWWLMAADGPRYKAIGNSKAVPCVSWLGQRLIATIKRGAKPS